MTIDEVKENHPMDEIVRRYGIRINRSGFISCPFHSEKTASMKLYKDSFHCFGCGENGDIFKFIQKMDDCDFKTAFYSLGGTFEKPTIESKFAQYKAHRAKQDRQERKRLLRKEFRLLNSEITIDMDMKNATVPFSDVWCEAMNNLQKDFVRYDEIMAELGKR